MLLMEPVIALRGFMGHYVRISAGEELMEKTACSPAAALQGSPATISVGSVLSVLITHSGINVRRCVIVIRMGLPSALMLMEDVSVNQTGLALNVIFTAPLGSWMVTASQVEKTQLVLVHQMCLVVILS